MWKACRHGFLACQGILMPAVRYSPACSESQHRSGQGSVSSAFAPFAATDESASGLIPPDKAAELDHHPLEEHRAQA